MAISGVFRQYDFEQYSEWVDAHDTLRDEDRQAIRDSMRRLPVFPTFSLVLLSTPHEGSATSQATIASASHQLYPHWELWLPDETDAGDPRLRIVAGQKTPSTDLASAFNAAVAAAEGEFVLPLPPGVTLAQSALFELATAIGHDPLADMLYTDEDHLNAEGRRCFPHFKTVWDPDLMLGRDAVGLLVAYRKALLLRLDGMRSCSAGIGPTLYDLALRASAATSPSRIHHIPTILCHRPADSETSFGWEPKAAREIVHQHLTSHGIKARVEAVPLAPTCNRIVHNLSDPPPPVSVIIPTRDRAELLECCTDALLNRTDYSDLELLIIDNDSREPAAVELLHRLSRHAKVRILSSAGSFNYSAMSNLGARHARGEILLLLNNDTDVIHADWLREMVSHAVRHDVGAVGAKLLYPDGRIQHAGVVLEAGVGPIHQFRFADRFDPGPCVELALTRTVSAVTAACLALRRSVFFEVDCFDENLAVAFNDIDLCLRISDHGYRIVWTPFSQLFHFEAMTRGYDVTPEKQALSAEEARYFSRFWAGQFGADPFRNPNLVFGWDSVTLSRDRAAHPAKATDAFP